jgi:hypothetical protein
MTKQQRKSYFLNRAPEEAPTGDIFPEIHDQLQGSLGGMADLLNRKIRLSETERKK